MARLKVLELFAGTGSIGKVFAADSDVTSLDVTGSPTIKQDILKWDYQALPEGHFDVIWASPPCTHYSRARTTAKTPRDLEGSDALVQKTLDIIAYFKPRCWAMENPQSGLLKGRAVVEGLPFKDVCYCRYGTPYRKATRIWTDLGSSWQPRPMCTPADPCPNMQGGRHPVTAQRRGERPGDRTFKQDELYAIPPALVQELRDAMVFHLTRDTQPLAA